MHTITSVRRETESPDASGNAVISQSVGSYRFGWSDGIHNHAGDAGAGRDIDRRRRHCSRSVTATSSPTGDASRDDVGLFGEVVGHSPRSGATAASAARGMSPADDVVAQRLATGWSVYVRFFRRYLRQPEDAEEAVQDFCLKALRAAVTLNDAGRIDAWLARILRNTLVDHYRRGAARRRAELAYWREAHATAVVPPSTDDGSPRYCVRRLLERLEPRHAMILRRFYLDEQARESIAIELGLTANNVGVRLHRAKQALRREFHAMSLGLDDGTLPLCDCGSVGGADHPSGKARSEERVNFTAYTPKAAPAVQRRSPDA